MPTTYSVPFRDKSSKLSKLNAWAEPILPRIGCRTQHEGREGEGLPCLEDWHVSEPGYEDAGHQDTGTLRGTITGRDDGRPEPSQHVGNNARGHNGGYRRCCDGNSNRDDDLARGGLTTMEMKISFFRPHIKGPLRAEGTVAKRGKRVAFAEAVLKNQLDQIVAKANGTWLFLDA